MPDVAGLHIDSSPLQSVAETVTPPSRAPSFPQSHPGHVSTSSSTRITQAPLTPDHRQSHDAGLDSTAPAPSSTEGFQASVTSTRWGVPYTIPSTVSAVASHPVTTTVSTGTQSLHAKTDHSTKSDPWLTRLGLGLSGPLSYRSDPDSSFRRLPGERSGIAVTSVPHQPLSAPSIKPSTSISGAGLPLVANSSLESISVSSLADVTAMGDSTGSFSRHHATTRGVSQSSSLLPHTSSAPQHPHLTGESAHITQATSSIPSLDSLLASTGLPAFATLSQPGVKDFLPSFSARHSEAALASAVHDVDLNSSVSSVVDPRPSDELLAPPAAKSDLVSASDATTANEEDFQRGMAALDAGIARLRTQLRLSVDKQPS